LDRIQNAASLLAAARLSALPVDALPVMMRPRDEAEAYWIQGAVHELIARSRFGERSGYKIGCTTAAMRKSLGIRTPCSGGIFAGATYGSGVTLRRQSFVQAGVEGQIAVRLGRDLLPEDGPYDARTLADAVDYYFAAVEVVDNRYTDINQTGAPTLIADDFFAAACVLGNPVAAEKVGEIGEVTCVTTVNEIEVARGTGGDVMQHPLNALAWLANALVGRGQTLKAGEIVLLGGISEPQWLEEGDKAVVDISGLGHVEVAVE
jgi:2-keto-4-pentenoate hydratase